MKKFKIIWTLFLDWLKITIQFIPTLIVTGLMSYLVLVVFANKLCDDKSLCYTIVIFLTGIIVTLKIKLLDTQTDYLPIFLKYFTYKDIIDNSIFRHKERIAFKLGTIINVLYLVTAFWLDCLHKQEEVIILLNGLIFLDFVILMRNIIITIRTYKNQINIKQALNCMAENDNDIVEIKTKKNKDLFEEWLNTKSKWIKIALTDSSFKNKYLRENKTRYLDEINKDLSTYGDSIIKICFIEILYGNIEKISVKKSNYESDKYLVEKVARHYKLLDYIQFDDEDDKIVKNYDFIEPVKTNGGNKKDSPHKYIATAVEAVIGAIYKETKDLNALIALLRTWIDFDDNI